MAENGFNIDGYAPAEMAQRVESVDVKKADLDWACCSEMSSKS